MAKAYDQVSQGFLKQVLKCFGFSDWVCRIIFECVETPWFSVMMNGITKGFFKYGKWLRQGDHLSPYLFIIMEEVLS